VSVEQIQALADGLATRLGRAVLVDDRDLRLVAASEDFGDADPARVWSWLHRRTRPEDVRHEEIARCAKRQADIALSTAGDAGAACWAELRADALLASSRSRCGRMRCCRGERPGCWPIRGL
jgi:hypothetical protein